ncbi:hypothetical protein BBJ29_007466 [Phytophthora kernoviae]|uniref:Hcy-binding domain-containing protein n=1 Tax=Phytophthora kernoviae TaxID=325452 RepID=A0A3F2RSF9_9STRA|nr:hypothetical protein BBJ29_007466 [Phytophthora kernoviae]RLN63354.1 hypothetical protein BBP00_00004199 [Phytophthora kernoviae]
MESKKIDILAGGITHELFRGGMSNDRNMLSASALMSPSRYGMVLKAYEAFIEAGATMIMTNNYYVSPGIGFNSDEIREYSRLADIAKALMQIKETPELLNEMQKKKIHLGGYGDHISPVSKAGAMEESMIPRELQSAMDMEVYSKFAMRWIDDGADIVGGCCEIPPDYLQHICETLSL